MRIAIRILFYLVLIMFAFLAAFPFYYMIAGSFMDAVEIYSRTPNLWPASFEFDAYDRIFTNVPMVRYFVNSLVVSGGTTVIAVLASSAAGYCFAHLDFIGKKFWFALVLATLIVPFQARIIPLFVMFNDYNLVNTYAGIMLPGLISAFGVFMMSQFFQSVPAELREAAIIDGASELGVFFRIFLPLAKPGVATLSVFTFITSWDDLLWPMIIAPSPDMRTIQVGLAFIRQTAQTPDQVMAAIVVVSIPVIIAFLLGQRYFVAGITSGAVKE